MEVNQIAEWKIPEGDVIRVTDSSKTILWQKSWPITYDLGGKGTNNPANPVKAVYEQTVIPISALANNGFKFTGWTPESDQCRVGHFDLKFTANWTNASEVYFGDVPAYLQNGSQYGIDFKLSDIVMLHFEPDNHDIVYPQRPFIHTADTREYVKTFYRGDANITDIGFVLSSNVDEFNSQSDDNKFITRQIVAHSWYHTDENGKIDWPNRLYVEGQFIQQYPQDQIPVISTDIPSDVSYNNVYSLKQKTLEKNQTILFSMANSTEEPLTQKQDIFSEIQLTYPKSWNITNPSASDWITDTGIFCPGPMYYSELEYNSLQNPNFFILIIKNPTDEIIQHYENMTYDDINQELSGDNPYHGITLTYTNPT